MRCYRILCDYTGTDVLTTDLTDVWSEIENTPDGHTIHVGIEEMSLQRFIETLKERGKNQLQSNIPWKDGSE